MDDRVAVYEANIEDMLLMIKDQLDELKDIQAEKVTEATLLYM